MAPAPTDEAQGTIIREFLGSIWLHKWLVIGFAAMGIVIGIVHLHRTPPSYTVTLRVASVALEQSQSRGSADRITGLAALAGVALPSSGNGIGFELYQAGLTGRPAAEALARQPEFMHALFPGEWDAANKQWREPRGLLRPLRRFVSRVLGTPVVPWQPPDAARVQEVLNGLVTMQKSAASPIVSISIRVPDPEWGKLFLSKLHAAVDGALRDKSLVRASRYIEYLNQELAATTITDVRASLVATLIDQEKQRMLASSGLDYAADPLEAPVASRGPTSPVAMQVIPLYLILGAMAGAVVAFLLGRFQLNVSDLLVAARKLAGRRRPQEAEPNERWPVTRKL